MTTVRFYDPGDESSLAKAERTAADLRDLLARLDENRIAVSTLVSGAAGQLALAKDIEVGVDHNSPKDDVGMTLTLHSHGNGTNPGKPRVYYREFQEFADALQHPGGMLESGRRLNGTPVDSRDSPVIGFTLRQAQSPKLAEKVQEMATRVDALVIESSRGWRAKTDMADYLGVHGRIMNAMLEQVKADKLRTLTEAGADPEEAATVIAREYVVTRKPQGKSRKRNPYDDAPGNEQVQISPEAQHDLERLRDARGLGEVSRNPALSRSELRARRMEGFNSVAQHLGINPARRPVALAMVDDLRRQRVAGLEEAGKSGAEADKLANDYIATWEFRSMDGEQTFRYLSPEAVRDFAAKVRERFPEKKERRNGIAR